MIAEGQWSGLRTFKKKLRQDPHTLLWYPVGENRQVAVRMATARERERDREERWAKLWSKSKSYYRWYATPLEEVLYIRSHRYIKVLKKWKPDAPKDLLKERWFLAGELLELSGKVEKGKEGRLTQKRTWIWKAYEKWLPFVKPKSLLQNLFSTLIKSKIKAEKLQEFKKDWNRKLLKLARGFQVWHLQNLQDFINFDLNMTKLKKDQTTCTLFMSESKGELNMPPIGNTTK